MTSTPAAAHCFNLYDSNYNFNVVGGSAGIDLQVLSSVRTLSGTVGLVKRSIIFTGSSTYNVTTTVTAGLWR